MIPSEHAEVALSRLGDVQTFFYRTARSLTHDATSRRLGPLRISGVGRLVSTAPDAIRAEERRTLCELTLVRIVSVVEAFVIELGEHELDGRLALATIPPDLAPLVKHLRDARWSSATGTGSWIRPLGFWNEALGVNAKQDFADWQALEFVRRTRNIIVHGLGAGDENWFGRARALRRLNAVGIAEAKAAGRIPVESTDVTAAVDTSRSFVLWLDRQRRITFD